LLSPRPADDAHRRSAALSAAAAAVRLCRCCPSMPAGVPRVPGWGLVGARVLFLAEAPGRLGAGRTGVSLTGDRSGALFWEMVGAAGLRRDQVFATNAVKCVPTDGLGRNRRPSRCEIEACGAHWRREAALVAPRLIVPLGDVACRALLGLPVAAARGRRHATPLGPAFALYHPGFVTRGAYPRQAYRRDWRAMAEALRELEEAGGHCSL
jgi:uracil-DNA glycosylase family 4